jgi:pimeloyl-ACP methyl ester carboxylesterase
LAPATIELPPRVDLMSYERFATGLDGTRIYVRLRDEQGGEGRDDLTAILCDGIACDGFIWKYLWDELARTVRVAHWHYRGHGRSGRPVDPARIELTDHVSDLDAVRREIGDGPVVLLGHSMGCQVAIESFRLRRDQIRGLVLICGSSGRITHTFRGTNVLAQLLPRLIERADAHPLIARALWSRVPSDMALWIGKLMGDFDVGTIHLEDLLPYMKHVIDIDLPMFLRMLRSAGEHSAADLLPSIDVPALVIAGDKDSFTPPVYAEQMAAALPKGELLMLAGATHVAPLERKEVVNERIVRFLREKVGA